MDLSENGKCLFTRPTSASDFFISWSEKLKKIIADFHFLALSIDKYHVLSDKIGSVCHAPPPPPRAVAVVGRNLSRREPS
jgi:hypothetical protein